MKLKSIALIVLLSLFFNGYPQSKKIENVKKISMNGVRTIKEKQVIKGYFSFFFLEKEDRKNNNYLLEIMDANLKTTHSIPITKTITSYLLEGQFNGSHFCFTFLDTKSKTLINDIYDQNGHKTGTYQITELYGFSYDYLYTQINNEDGYYSGTTIPIEGKGFAIIYSLKSDKGYSKMDLFDFEGNKIWTSSSKNISSSGFNIKILLSNKDFIIFCPSQYNYGINKYCCVIDTKNGSDLPNIDISATESFLVPHGIDFIEEDQELVMFGEVYGEKREFIDIKNKKGFFVNVYDTKGNLKKQKICGWKEDIGKKVDLNDKGKFADGISIMIHNVVKTKDGRYFAIGEQFNKEVSAGGVAAKVILGANSNAALLKMVLYNFMTFEFNSEMELVNIETIVSNKTNVYLPQGMGIISEDQLGYFIKIYGWFNYNFTTINEDRTNFSSTYTVYNKGGENKDNRYTVGVITLDSDKKLVNTKLDLKSKPTAFVTLPTKPGYVAIFEYFRKEKYAEIRLEKLDL